MDELDDLTLIERLLDTLDRRGDQDHLVRPSDLADWLRQQGLYDGPARVSRTDLTRVVELRDALRDAVGRSDPDTIAAVEHACAPFPLGLGRTPAGALGLVATGAGAQAAVGTIVAAAARAHTLGTWDRLKLCPGPDCGRAFVDHSRNRSRRWCEMRSCGNQAKVTAYRSKRRATVPAWTATGADDQPS